MATASSARYFRVFIFLLLICTVTAIASIAWYKQQQAEIKVLTHSGILEKIQHLNNLETVAFHIDTVVSSQKEGSWNKLWQDEQKGLFVASGRVVAGLNLSKLTADQVKVSNDGKQIEIDLPAVEILSSSLDKTEIYDIETGLFGLVDIDPKLMTEAQLQARKQMIATACKSGILSIANDNATKQIEALFTLTQASIKVNPHAVGHCP